MLKRINWLDPEDNIKVAVKRIDSKCVHWINLAHDWVLWRAAVNTSMGSRVI